MRKDLAVHTAMEVGKELDGSVTRASKHKLSLSEMAYQAAVCVELTVVALVSGKLLPEWPLSIATAATGRIPDLPLQLLSPPPWASLLTDSPTRCSCLLDLSLSPHPSASAFVSQCLLDGSINRPVPQKQTQFALFRYESSLISIPSIPAKKTTRLQKSKNLSQHLSPPTTG